MAKTRNKIAVYPGTFDPLTRGHISLIRRALDVFDGVLIAVAEDTGKNTLFSLTERVEMAKEVFADEPRIEVEPFSGLLVEYVRQKKLNVVLRGMRALSDFEYEFQMALVNRKLASNIQTVFLMTDYKWLYLSSTVVREMAKFGGDLQGLVPSSVQKRLEAKMKIINEINGVN